MNLFFKILLLPFTVLYGITVFLRNKFYDWGLFRSVSYHIPVICVGNISAGGTGKTPAIEYLIRILQKQNYNIATLSRGYGRKTKGYILADSSSTATIIGDEPLQFQRKFQHIRVSVCENRVTGINLLLEQKPSPDVILLDDAIQHRRVKPGLTILLTEYDKLYSSDWLLPSGRLREFRTGACRANIIIVTKSPEHLMEKEKQDIVRKLKPKKDQTVLFSFIRYQEPVAFFDAGKRKLTSLSADTEILLFSGIANPKPLELYLKTKHHKVDSLSYGDHHVYTENDLKKISQKFRNIASENKAIFTTEKDFMRLVHHEFITEWSDVPVYYLPLEMAFNNIENLVFEQIILSYAEKN